MFKYQFNFLICILFFQIGALLAQEEKAINNKGTIVKVRNNEVTTNSTAPSTPLQNDTWFDTAAQVTKVYDGTTWLTINLNALAAKEDGTNKSTDINLSDVTNTKFPTELAVKTYVDGLIASSGDDDITAVTFDGTNLKVDEGSTTFSADLSSLRDSDWFQANSTVPSTSINQDIYTQGNVGIGLVDPNNKLELRDGAISFRNSDYDYTAVGIDYDKGTDQLRFRTNDASVNLDSDAMVIDRYSRRVGIGTTSPSAQLEIESDGVPFEIKPSTSTPTGTQTGQIFVGDDGILYVYDASRGKWLSVDRTSINWSGISGSTSSYEYLVANASVSSENGYRMIRDATITGISAQTSSNTSWSLYIYKNDGTGIISFLTLTNETGNHANNINVDLNEGDYIQAFCWGSNIDTPLASMEFAWRK